MKTGITDEKRNSIVEGLNRVLADTYSLYLKTQNWHWNVTGPMFHSVHNLTEVQYTEMAAAIDEVGERIRALNEPAPGTFSEYLKLSSVKEVSGVPSAEEMVKDLAEANEAVVCSARDVVAVAEEAHDTPTADLMTARIQVHEKNAWMWRSFNRN